VQQFKEAFSLIDQDGDGIVTEDDLKRIFASLGQSHSHRARAQRPIPNNLARPLPVHLSHSHSAVINPTRENLDELLSSRPGGAIGSLDPNDKDSGVNFMEFLMMMGEHLFEFYTEAEPIKAFESFHEADSGFVKSEMAQRGRRKDGSGRGSLI